ncbi:MAG: glucan biosynthesis protein [Sedimentisphaerales bacterium]|nr:glucan biosynthesis protein [Sedimentisphaerales bacterium]
MSLRTVRGVVGILIWLFVVAPAGANDRSPPSGRLAELRRQAQERAKQPFQPDRVELPQALRDLDYDGYRAISFRSQRALWVAEKLPFQVEFFHRGYLFPQRVRVFILEDGQRREVAFSPRLFDYSQSAVQPEELPEDLGFAGLRLLYPIHQADRHHEFISFLGASYFRSLGAHQVYGASARGLAVGMGSPIEEFPYFETFWVEEPSAGARTITMYALLDSASVTGAYRFDIGPGETTLVEVRAEVFARTSFNDVGVAPLTSMYFYGRNGPKRLQNSRPEVHDSDGLLLDNGAGEWTWRPLWNPETISLSTLQVEAVKGFGLIQRARDPCDYRDPRTSYERRPSIWVEPLADWRDGGIRLLELPSDGEGQDNIGACWIPPASFSAAGSLSLEYRLHFGKSVPEPNGIGKVVATRWSESSGTATRFAVDFDLGAAGADPQQAPEAVVTASAGEVSAVQTRRDPATGHWRTTFEASPHGGQIMEIRAFLQQDERKLTEVWNFAWPR